ncbi:hypothetical protein ACWCQ0_30125 [Streptomyces massasporeus]
MADLPAGRPKTPCRSPTPTWPSRQLANALADSHADVRKAVLAPTRHRGGAAPRRRGRRGGAGGAEARAALARATTDSDADVRAYAGRAL